jgi:hypothetical protein
MSFYPGFKKWNFTIASASYFDNRAYLRFCILWGQFYIHIPFIRSKYDECDPPRYGFYFYSIGGWIPDNFVICYGKKTKFYHMPWELDWVRTSVLLKDSTWANETKGNRQDFWRDEWDEKKWKEIHPYMYTLKNGTTQHRIATITVDEDGRKGLATIAEIKRRETEKLFSESGGVLLISQGKLFEESQEIYPFSILKTALENKQRDGKIPIYEKMIEVYGLTNDCPIAAMGNPDRKIYSMQN